MAHPIIGSSNFGYNILNKELDLTEDEKTFLEVFLKAYFDDFWQGGKGSLLPPTSGASSSTLDSVLEKRFVFRNVIRECVARVSGAFFGKSPNWKFQVNGLDPEDEAPLTEIDKALGQFWTSQNISDVMTRAFESRLVFGRGGIRLYIPTKYKRQNATGTGPEERVQFATPQEALKAMRVEFVQPEQGRLLDDGGELFSIVKYSVRENWETREQVAVIEFSFVDDANVTWLGTVKERDDPGSPLETNLSSGFDLAGGTTYSEFKGHPYVSKALYKNNQLLNLALTCAGFSLVDNGFGEMILTNVELDTETVVGPGGPVEVPKKIKRGGGVVQNFVGIENVDEATGSARRETPGVTFREPTQMTVFKGGADMAYAACLQEAGQIHALISGDATASGESRVQALADFALRITKYKSEVDEQGSWLLTTALKWAAALAGGTAESLSVMFDCKVHIASLSTSEKESIMNMRQKGTISRETERVLLGVEDPALEAELVSIEQHAAIEETPLEELSEKADVALKLLGIGIDSLVIQSFLGFSEEQIAMMAALQAEKEAEYLAGIQNPGGAPSPGGVEGA